MVHHLEMNPFADDQWPLSSQASSASARGASLIRQQLQLPASPSRYLRPSQAFAGQVPFLASQQPATGGPFDDDLPMAPQAWSNSQVRREHVPDRSARVPGTSQPRRASSPSESNESDTTEQRHDLDLTGPLHSFTNSSIATDPQPRAPTAQPSRPCIELTTAATLAGLAEHTSRPDASALDLRAPAFCRTDTPTAEPRSPLSGGPSSDAHIWPLRADLGGTPAHFYRGPLSARQVLDLISQPLSKNASQALLGKHGGYLQYFHFLGHSVVPPNRKRPSKPPRKDKALPESSTSVGRSKSTKLKRVEAWRCRACHTDLHVPSDQISNLGLHLYGPAGTSKGCLTIRASDPAEPLPHVPRDSNGSVLRLRPDKPIPARKPSIRSSSQPSVPDPKHGTALTSISPSS